MAPKGETVLVGFSAGQARIGGARMEVRLPRSYYLERDPDLIVLRRRGDSHLVAAFSARGAAREEIERAAREDLRLRGSRPVRY